jgi:hypothetical protein
MFWGPMGSQNTEIYISNNKLGLWYSFFFFLYIIVTKIYNLTIRDFRQRDASIKSVESSSVLWRPSGTPPWSVPLKSSPEPSCRQ